MPQARQAGRSQQQDREAVILDTVSRHIGSRWYGDAPTGAEVAEWFEGNVALHEGLEHDRYVQGVTMISQSEKGPEIRDDRIVEVQRLVHVPYIKVETRVAYFWDLMLEKGCLGVIEPVDVPRVEASGINNSNLPKGFFRIPVPVIQNGQPGHVHFIACSMKVTVYEPDIRSGGRGRVVMDPPPATKQIAMIDRWGKPDPYALMKAETGAVGRALGMAGMLVLPGSGVATAEDMQEMQAATGAGASADEAQLPAGTEGTAADAPESLADMISRLQSAAPKLYQELEEWAAERKPAIKLDAVKSTQERAVRAQVERKLATLAAA